MIEHRHHMPRCIEGALDPPDEEINHTGVDDELAVEEELYQKEAEKIVVGRVDRHYGDSTQPRHQIRQIEAPLDPGGSWAVMSEAPASPARLSR